MAKSFRPACATRLLLVAGDKVPAEAIGRLLEVIFASRFSQLVYPPLLPELLNLAPELGPHAGTTAYLRLLILHMSENWLNLA
jgi:hypothetical protein